MWVVGQVVGLDRWINVSWVMWWRGFGSVEIGGFLDGDWGFLGGMGSSRLELIVWWVFFFFFFMWFWFYGLVGGVRICGGGSVLVGGMVAIFFYHLLWLVLEAEGEREEKEKRVK